jgi:cytochrome bd-type quinol oxidase subunit 2
LLNIKYYKYKMKKMLAKISTGALTSVVAISGMVSSVLAQSGTATPPKPAGDWIKGLTGVSQPLESWIVTLLNWAIGLAALAAVVMLIVAGYLYITANGDENKVEKATKTLTFAIVGLVVCFIAVILVQFVLANFLGQ